NFINPLGFNPTLAIMYTDLNNENMPTAYPDLYSALMENKDEFDFTPHIHYLDVAYGGQPQTYDMALSLIREDRDGISSWGFLPTLYYMVPGNNMYSEVTAP